MLNVGKRIVIAFAPAARASAAYILRIKIAPECHRRLDTFDHDQIIVLPLEAGCGKVHGTGVQQLAVNFIALEMHRIARLVLDPDLDARRLGEVIENLRGLALGKLGAVEIDSHLTPRSAARVSACMAWLLHPLWAFGEP